MKTFNLPDLGEGLPEAEIVTWHVKEGDSIAVDQPLVSVETAKAVVDVPSPYAGRVAKLYAKEGDIVETHKPLVDYDIGEEAAGQTRPATKAPAEEPPRAAVREDSGTVVGQMQSSDEVLEETAIVRKKKRRGQGASRPKAAPAVRALAKKEGIDLNAVEGTGKNGLITADDVQRHREQGEPAVTTARAAAPQPHKLPAGGIKEQLRGPRRAMAQSMARSRDEVTPCTLFDDADIHDWLPGQDITARVLRAIVAGCRAEPGLNGFFDGASLTRQIMTRVDVAMAVDTPDGLIVPVVRDVAGKDGSQLRDALNKLKEATRNRTVAPEDMRDYTIMLSNFGMLAGRYATPVIVPPAVAIIGTGGIRHDVVGVMGGIEVHKRIPLSLTFDHRCITGGEACRFLGGVIKDLQRGQ